MVLGLLCVALDQQRMDLIAGLEMFRKEVPARVNVRYEWEHRPLDSPRPARWLEGFVDFRARDTYTEKLQWMGGGRPEGYGRIWTCVVSRGDVTNYGRSGREFGEFGGPAVRGVEGVREVTNILSAGIGALRLNFWGSTFAYGRAGHWRGRIVKEIEQWSETESGARKTRSYYFEAVSGRLLGYESIGQFINGHGKAWFGRETLFVSSVTPLPRTTPSGRTR